VFQREDDDGRVGVELNRDLVKVAGKALEANLTKLGPLVLPLSEKAKFAFNLLQRNVIGMKVKPYVPDFKTAFDHFCLHAGAQSPFFHVCNIFLYCCTQDTRVLQLVIYSSTV
jgi:3-ketoacyl-CoA synthase